MPGRFRYGAVLIFQYFTRDEEGHECMRGASKDKRTRRVVAIVVAVLMVVAIVGAVVYLTNSIDRKLNQSAEQQVVTFTEQAAAGVSDRMFMVQNAIGAFAVQSADPAKIVPALVDLKESIGFADVAFAATDGTGLNADGKPFNVADLAQVETALSQERYSYSGTFANNQGAYVRLAQRPLYIDGKLAGALYVQIPLSLFTMPSHLDMFDGRGYFIVLEASSGEILVAPQYGTKTPVGPGASLYDFLRDASSFEPSSSFGGAEALLAFQAQQGSRLSELRKTVESGVSGLTTASVDGRGCYVCTAPVGEGYWYVCSIVPVDNVRAEAAVVTTTFQAVFGIVFVCLVLVGLLLFTGYRRRVRERNVAMMSQLYRALSDSVELAVNLYSRSDGKVTPIVAKSASIIGYPLADFLKNPQLENEINLSPAGSKLFDRIRDGAIDGIEKGEFSFCCARTGSQRWVSYSVKPLMFDGKSQLLIVLRDSTSEKEIRLSMKDAMDAADAANQAKSEFLSRMSHEIRTPMNVIIGMLQIAQANVDDLDKMRESFTKIGAASDHLLGLINDVLDLSKIENGKMTLASEPFRLTDIVSQAIAVVKPQCEQRGQHFKVETAPEADGVYVGDFVRMRQVLVNLLTNAVKYTPRDGLVHLETSVSPGAVMGYRRVLFTVSDNGIGMSEDFVGHLFEPFVMEGRSHEQGTGLGMSIVKNIVTMMGGNIEVDSAVGKGTTFRVAVNLRVAFETERELFEQAAEADGEDDDAPAECSECVRAVDACLRSGVSSFKFASPAEPSAFERSELEGLRVLLVEDNELNAEIAQELLAEAGLVIERASDGDEGCAMFEASPVGYYDVILMDVQMPRMNGYDATRGIRASGRPDAARVPIIAMSANAFAEDVSASLASGMDAHLSKPIEVRRVLATIVQFVRNRG